MQLPSSAHLVIMEEIQRTKCSPREVCLEVAKEFPESTSRFYVPRCVSAHRCGGCCNSEAWQCTNTSYTVMNKTVRDHRPNTWIWVLESTEERSWFTRCLIHVCQEALGRKKGGWEWTQTRQEYFNIIYRVMNSKGTRRRCEVLYKKVQKRDLYLFDSHVS